MAEAKSRLYGGRGATFDAVAVHRWPERRAAFESGNLREPFLGGVFVHGHDAVAEPPSARVYWLESHNPAVVVVDAEQIPMAPNVSFDLSRFRDIAEVLVDGTGRELVLLSDGVHQIQFTVRNGTVLSGPVHLRYHIEGFDHIETKMLTLARLNALVRYGRFPASLFQAEPNAAKWAKALQAHDGMMAGASQREIAIAIFGRRTVEAEWNGRSDFLRSRTHRMLNYARAMTGGGYRDLLAR